MASEDNTVADLEKQLAGLEIDETPNNLAFVMPSMEPLTSVSTFLVDEHNSPISLLDDSFYAGHKEADNYASLYSRAQGWAAYAGVTSEVEAEIEEAFRKHVEAFIEEKKPFDRIYIRDSERTFNAPANRAALCHVLTYLQKTCLDDDYHQGLSMIVGFLMSVLRIPTVIAMIESVQRKSAIKGVWKAQSIVAAVDGYIFKSLLQEHYPELDQHITKYGVIPEMYASKYWCAFGIHILPFHSLVLFLDQFFSDDDVIALFRVLLLVVLTQKDRIMSSKRIDQIVELLSIDHKVYMPEYVNSILYKITSRGEPIEQSEEDKALRAKIETILDAVRDREVLAALRTKTFDAVYGSRVSAATADFEQETTPDCQYAECTEAKEQGFYYCIDCKQYLCENCAYCTRDGHNDDDHDIRMLEDLEPEDLE